MAEQQAYVPQLQIRADRAAMARFGVTLAALGELAAWRSRAGGARDRLRALTGRPIETELR